MSVEQWAQAWRRQAEDDVAAAKQLIGLHPSQAIWLASQASEKAHKALLFALGLNVGEETLKRFGHDVGELLDVLPAALLMPKDAKHAERVNTLQELGDQTRYPSLRGGGNVIAPCDHGPLKASAKTHVDRAEEVLRWCAERETRARAGARAMKPAPSPEAAEDLKRLMDELWGDDA